MGDTMLLNYSPKKDKNNFSPISRASIKDVNKRGGVKEKNPTGSVKKQSYKNIIEMSKDRGSNLLFITLSFESRE